MVRPHTTNYFGLSINFVALPQQGPIWSTMTLNYWMMVERYPNLKKEVCGSIPGHEISSLLDIKSCQVVNYLLCFWRWLVGLLSQKKFIKNKSNLTLTLSLRPHQLQKWISISHYMVFGRFSRALKFHGHSSWSMCMALSVALTHGGVTPPYIL